MGKTIFGLRWLTQGMDLGKRCLYVTFQDTADQLTGVAAAFGWDLSSADAAENISIFYVPMGDLDLDFLATAMRSDSVSIDQPDRYRQPGRTGLRGP